MKIWSKVLRVAERGLLVLGLLLVVAFSVANIHRVLMFRSEMTRFEVKQRESAKEGYRGKDIFSSEKPADTVYQTRNIDHSFWSAQRTRLYQPVSVGLLLPSPCYEFPSCTWKFLC